jgi:hypothetical protein
MLYLGGLLTIIAIASLLKFGIKYL